MTDENVLADPQRLATIRDLGLVDEAHEEAFDRLTRLASRLIPSPVALVSIVEEERQYFKSFVGLPDPLAAKRETPLSHSFCQHVVTSGNPLIVDDARQDPLVKDNLGISELGIISYLGMPLTTQDGHRLGSFCVIDGVARHWTADDIETMRDLARSVMTEIELRNELQRVQAMTEELEYRNEELDAFAYTVAHDLKNPISTMMGYTSLIQAYLGEMSEEEVMQYLDMIIDSGFTLKGIIDSLLLLSGVRSMQNVDIVPLDMSIIVQDSVKRLDKLVTDHDAEIQMQSEWPVALGYGPWVEEVWMNYISNAVKYGGDPPQIELGATPTGDDMIEFWVKDNGKGLSEDEQTRLFTPFTRLNQAKIEGHGLGLSVVQRIVQRLDGRVFLSSAVGAGSTFSFTLPIAEGFEV